MKLTLDGLVKAMRWQAHGLAEEAEQDYRRAKAERPAGGARRLETGETGERGTPA